ncbi:hypothetical protein AJ80_01720 [Polytolypa hystricis UAMH7299]|uniref:Chaperone/heat shock protein Hsp12 n=1 Tax=Polytolypa hystricis (strain UAMH7299) TaxID=1447883 RepID=A0A2B7YZV2_POLH7|nr:hypothetical protein AJ80_01720 [Polytolypa hystricis UAMH7299]
MADSGRKDFSTRAQEQFTPESAKSTQQKAKETVTDTADRVTRGTQPDSQKSAGQGTVDKAQRASDNQQGGTTSTIGDKVKGALGMDK